MQKTSKPLPLLTIMALISVVIATAMVGCGGPGTSEDVVMPKGIPLPVKEDRPHHEQEVRHLAISPDGTVLATVSSDSMQLWNTTQMAPFAVISSKFEFDFIQDVVLSVGGHYVAVLNRAGSFYMWDTESLEKREIRNRWGDDPLRLFGFDGQDRLYWATIDDRLLQWDLSNGLTEAKAPVEVDYLGPLSSFARNGEHWLLRADGKTVQLDAADSPTLSTLEVSWPDERPQSPPIPLGADAGAAGVFGNDVWKVGTGDGNRKLATRAVRAPAGPDDLVAETAVDPSGRWLAVAWDSGGIELWDLEKEELSGQLKIGPKDVRKVHPIKVLDVAMSNERLFVLLPEQKLVWYRVGDWLRQGETDL